MAAKRGAPPFRAEHIGSLLRPRSVKDAFRALREGRLDAAAYEACLGREIGRVIRLQEDLGFKAVTDGELRRSSWFGFFLEGLDGFRQEPSLFSFRDGEGRRHSWSTAFAEAPIRRAREICAREFAAIQGAATRLPKATIPSPTAFHFFRGDACADRAVYPDIDAFWRDLIAVYRAEIDSLAALGCRYLQIDEVPLAMLCDDGVRAQLTAPDRLTEKYIEVVNAVLEACPDGMTTAMHLCRGNFRSRWMAEGGYEPVAERLFNDLRVDAFFLEYDTPRAGDFAPLRLMAGDKDVVLGLISTKTPEREDASAVARRIDTAARHMPLDRLGVSPQCGFASVAGGNAVGEDDQTRKLALVVEVAGKVWGGV